MKVKLKDLPYFIFAKIDAKNVKICMDKYFEAHKNVDPNTVLEFNIPECFKTEEEQKESISKFYRISVKGSPLNHLETFARTDLVGIAKSYNSCMAQIGKYEVTNLKNSYGLGFVTSERGMLVVDTDLVDYGDEYYHGANKLELVIKDTRKTSKKERNSQTLKSFRFYDFPMERIADIHKILIVYDYALKQSEKLTVKLTEGSIYPYIINVIEEFLNGTKDCYGYKTFYAEQFEFVNKFVNSLDEKIIRKAYASAEKTAQKLSENQQSTTSQVDA